MSNDLSIKDLVVLFENNLRTKEEFKKHLEAKSKEDLIDYIAVEVISEYDALDAIEDENEGQDESDFDY